jgi:hypothetical protein
MKSRWGDNQMVEDSDDPYQGIGPTIRAGEHRAVKADAKAPTQRRLAFRDTRSSFSVSKDREVPAPRRQAVQEY